MLSIVIAVVPFRVRLAPSCVIAITRTWPHRPTGRRKMGRWCGGPSGRGRIPHRYEPPTRTRPLLVRGDYRRAAMPSRPGQSGQPGHAQPRYLTNVRCQSDVQARRAPPVAARRVGASLPPARTAAADPLTRPAPTKACRPLRSPTSSARAAPGCAPRCARTRSCRATRWSRTSRSSGSRSCSRTRPHIALSEAARQGRLDGLAQVPALGPALLVREQPALAVEAARVAAEAAAGVHDAVAGHDDRERVAPDRRADGAGGAGL